MSQSENERVQAAETLAADLHDFCESDALSKEGLLNIIERHRLTQNNNRNVSDYYFFLRACENKLVDLGIIQCLLEYFPNAVSETDNDGWTPLHCACRNKVLDEGIIQYLLECFPGAASAVDNDGWTPLHCACHNKNVTLKIAQVLIDAAPDSVRSVDNKGSMPLHRLCYSKGRDEVAAIEILKLLLEKFPESTHQFDGSGNLPLHYASSAKSPEFCRVLIEAHPGSERMVDARGIVPFHWACTRNTLATVEYLYKVYPDAINHAVRGVYPIHFVIGRLFGRLFERASIDKKLIFRDTVDIVRFLLDCDANVKLQKARGKSLLQYACGKKYDDSNIDAGLQIIKVIYDAHPKALRRIGRETRELQVQVFLHRQLAYTRQTKDRRLMTTPDEKGQLPLHTALQNNVRLGSIKLLMAGNPSAVRCPDENFALPLHLACQYHESSSVVQYLLDAYQAALNAVDGDGNTVLHYACRGAKYETIGLLLEKYDAQWAWKRNCHKKLPIDFLWESNDADGGESIAYLDSVYRLLKANPEMLLNVNVGMESGRKRKRE